MATNPKMTFGLYDLEVRSDSTPTAPNLQPFSKIEDLRTGNVFDFPYASYEPNFWLLDGITKILPTNYTNVHVGMMSSAMSNSSGVFAVAPVLTITFEIPHTTDGLVLHFFQHTDDYANSITVAYYDGLDVLICTNNYSPDSWEYEIDLDVVGFRKVIITFHSTNKPYRYLRLTSIDFGQLITFTTADIKSAEVVEEIDMLSTTLPVNVCNLTIYSTDTDFSIVNPIGYYARLSQRQPLSIYEIVNGSQKFIGRYYLSTWKNASEDLFEFSCIDAVGVLDKIPYHGGLWLPAGILSQDLVEQIMATASVPYELDTELYDIPVIGWIPSCSCREALQQVAFAIGAYVDCSRSNLVKVYKSVVLDGTETNVTVITKEDRSLEHSLELKTLVTGVEVTSHNYAQGSDALTLFNGELSPGTYEIDFVQPTHSLEITGGVIYSSGVNYAIISVFETGTVLLTGLSYTDNLLPFNLYNRDLGSYVIPNIVKVTDATLVSKANGASVVNRMYYYYQQRFLQKAKLYSPVVVVGQTLKVETLSDRFVLGVIEKMSIDLSGGFIADTKIVGVVA